MIAPYRITQIEVARIGSRTDYRTTNRAGRGTQCGIASRRTNRCTTGRAQKRAAGGTIARVGTATRNHQGRGKSQDRKSVV